MIKKIVLLFLFLLLAIGSSTISYAKVLGGKIIIGGDDIIRIEVGKQDDSEKRSLARRIRRLEKAVRVLQNMVLCH